MTESAGGLIEPAAAPRGKRGAWKLSGAEFHKQYRDDLTFEFEKAQKLHELSQRFGFTTPQPLRLEPDLDRIVFSRLANLRSIRDIFLQFVCETTDSDRAGEVFSECGRVLAIIHGNLELSSREPWRPLGHFASWQEQAEDPPQAFVHGDYGFANVFVLEGRPGVVVLDASPNYFVTFSTICFGPIYLDLANMLACMDGLVPWARHFKMRLGRVRLLERAFTEGYQAESRVSLDEALLVRFTEATSLTYLQERLGNRLLGRVSHLVLYNPIRQSRLRPLI